jgi:hypothetical protein
MHDQPLGVKMKSLSRAALVAICLSLPVQAQQPSTGAQVYEGAVNCTAYQIYAAIAFEEGSDAAKGEEEKAEMFLDAAYLANPAKDNAVAEGEIESTLEGMLVDKETGDQATHAKNIGDMKAACAAFEPVARDYLKASAPAVPESSVN